MPTMITIHRANGETADMAAIDARQAVREHPDEWSTSPFPYAVQGQAKLALDPHPGEEINALNRT